MGDCGCRELGLPRFFDTEDGEKQLSWLAKQAYRRGNHYNSMSFNAAEWNRIWAMDLLETELAHQGVGGRAASTEEAGGGRSTTSKHAYQRALRGGENCLTGATDTVPLLLLSACASPGVASDCAMWRQSKVKLAKTLAAEVEGLPVLQPKLEEWLELQNPQQGPTRGRGHSHGEGGVLGMRGPDDGMIYLHNSLAVAPGRVAPYRRGYREVMPVRASARFRGREWKSDVEVEGETPGPKGTSVQETWYARVLLLFSCYSTRGGEAEPTSYELAFIRWFGTPSEPDETTCRTVTWELTNEGGPSYDIIPVDYIQGPAFLIPKFGDHEDDVYYISRFAF